MKKEIRIAVIEIAPIEDLAIGSVCSFVNIGQEEILSRNPPNKHVARAKAFVMLLLKKECDFTSIEAAGVLNTTRQNVDYWVSKMEAEVSVYKRAIADYRSIKTVFYSLLEEQQKFLKSF